MTIEFEVTDNSRYLDIAEFIVNHHESQSPADLKFKQLFDSDEDVKEIFTEAVKTYIHDRYELDISKEYTIVDDSIVKVENGPIELKSCEEHRKDAGYETLNTSVLNNIDFSKAHLALRIQFYDDYSCVNWKTEEKLHTNEFQNTEIGGVHTIVRAKQNWGHLQGQRIENQKYLFGDRTHSHQMPYYFALKDQENEEIAYKQTQEFYIYIFKHGGASGNQTDYPLIKTIRYKDNVYYEGSKQRSFILLHHYFTNVQKTNPEPYFLLTSPFKLSKRRIRQLEIDTPNKAKRISINKDELKLTNQYRNDNSEQIRNRAKSEKTIPKNYDFIIEKFTDYKGVGCTLYLPDILKELKSRHNEYVKRLEEYKNWSDETDRKKQAYISLMIFMLFQPNRNHYEQLLEKYIERNFADELPAEINKEKYIKWLTTQDSLANDWEKYVDYAAFNLVILLNNGNSRDLQSSESYGYQHFDTLMGNYDWGIEEEGDEQDSLRLLGQLVFKTFHEDLVRNWYGHEYIKASFNAQLSDIDNENISDNRKTGITYLRSLFDLNLRNFARSKENEFNSTKSVFSVTKKWTGATIILLKDIFPVILDTVSEQRLERYLNAVVQREMSLFIAGSSNYEIIDTRLSVTVLKPSKVAKMTFKQIDDALEEIAVDYFHTQKFLDDVKDSITGTNPTKLLNHLSDLFESANILLSTIALWNAFDSENQDGPSAMAISASCLSFAGAIADFMSASNSFANSIRNDLERAFPKLVKGEIGVFFGKMSAVLDTLLATYSLYQAISEDKNFGICLGCTVEIVGSLLMCTSVFLEFSCASANLYLVLAGLILQGLGILLQYVNDEDAQYSAIQDWMKTCCFGTTPGDNYDQQVRSLLTILYDVHFTISFDCNSDFSDKWVLKISIESKRNNLLPRCSIIKIEDLQVRAYFVDENDEVIDQNGKIEDYDIEDIDLSYLRDDAANQLVEQLSNDSISVHAIKEQSEHDVFTKIELLKEVHGDTFDHLEPSIVQGSGTVSINFFQDLSLDVSSDLTN